VQWFVGDRIKIGTMENIIDNYIKIKQLGHTHGGRSTWLAQDEQGRKVVVKEFAFGGGETKWSELKAIEQEAKTLAALDHPQIPKLIEQYETEQGYSIVMEYIEGETLAGRIGFPVPESQLTDIAKQSLEILSYVHDRGLLHRDIKPENIIIGSDGKVNLVDFGLSRNPNNVGSSTALMGTQGFMPLEQLRAIFKPASDLYGLGMTLVCLATGTKTSDAVSLVAEDFSVRFDLHSQYGRELDKWLHELTAVAIGDRPQTAKKAMARLGNPVIVSDTQAVKGLSSPTFRGILCGIAVGMVSVIGWQTRNALIERQNFVDLKDEIQRAVNKSHSEPESGLDAAYKLLAAPKPPTPLAHTPEYDTLVEKHIDTNLIKRGDLDLAVVKEELSQQFAVYRFRHSKLYGHYGYLTVLVNRSANNSTRAVSLRDINGKPPIMTIKGECLSVPQNRSGITEDRKICFD
jgi:serine/threonine protein kinase